MKSKALHLCCQFLYWKEILTFQLKTTKHKDTIFCTFKFVDSFLALVVEVTELAYELTLGNKEARKRKDLGIDYIIIQVCKSVLK